MEPFILLRAMNVLRRVRLEQTVADLSSAVSSVFTGDGSPAFSIRDALDISTHVAHMLTRPRYTSWDLRKSEIWIIHGDHELSDAVLITSKLVQAHFENCYEGADLRGILSVAIKGKNVAMPVYLWHEFWVPRVESIPRQYPRSGLDGPRPKGRLTPVPPVF